MRTIYWRRYGVVMPLVILTSIISIIVIVVTHDTGKPKHTPDADHKPQKDVKKGRSLETDADFAELVRRPNLGDYEDEESFDDDLVQDPEDAMVDVDNIITDPDLIPDSERLRSNPQRSGTGDVIEEKNYTTDSPSDLVEDNDGHGKTTASATTETTATTQDMPHTKSHEHVKHAATTATPFVQDVKVPEAVGPPAEHLMGMDYHQGGPAPIDFLEGPLTEDEEYALHLDDDQILQAREGMHAHGDATPNDDAPAPHSDVPETAGDVPVSHGDVPVSHGNVPTGQDDMLAPASVIEAVQGPAKYPSHGSPQYVYTGAGSLVQDSNMVQQPDYVIDDVNYVAHDDEQENEEEQAEEQEPYEPPEKPLNVLFIVADDLRPQFGSQMDRDYVAPNDKHVMHTPHIDKLAKRSLVLKRAFAQYSMCGPSRASLMTSRRPDVTKVYQNYVYWRYWSVGNFSSIPQYFKDHGYSTLGAGKVYHVDLMPKDYDPPSWSMPFFRPRPSEYDRNTSVNWAAVPANATEPLVDQNTVQYAIEKMPQLSHNAQNGKPFFFAVGFNQPHFRHICPAEFFEHYPLEKKKCMFQESWQTPPYMPRANLAQLVEGVNNTDLTNIPSIPMREIRRAYFACVSYVDDLIGKLVKGLEDNGLAESTIVAVVSDHGYHLGDNYMFGTYSNHDIALHVPLIMHIPGRTERGIASRSLAELVDVFPTLAQAAGLPTLPQCPERSSEVQSCTDGVSLLPLIRRPKRYVKDAVYSQLQRGRSLTEYTIRTYKYRLVDLALHRRTMLYPGVYEHRLDFDLDLRGRQHGRRLYDLTKDPLEAVNCVDDPAYADTLARLRAKLRHKFTNVYDYSKFLFSSFPE